MKQRPTRAVPDSEGNEIGIRDSRSFWFASTVVMLATGAVVAAAGLTIAFPICAIYAGWTLFRALTAEVRLRITDEGIIDRTHWFSPGLIRWEEIGDVRPGRWGFIEVELLDEMDFWERLPRIKALPRFKWQLYGIGPAALYGWGLEGSSAGIVEVLQDGLDRYVVRAAAEAARLEPARPEE